MKNGTDTEPKFVRALHRGDFFGEKALQGYELIKNGLTNSKFDTIKKVHQIASLPSLNVTIISLQG